MSVSKRGHGFCAFPDLLKKVWPPYNSSTTKKVGPLYMKEVWPMYVSLKKGAMLLCSLVPGASGVFVPVSHSEEGVVALPVSS